MSTLSKTYDPQGAEQRWYRFWQQRGDFQPASGLPSYSIFLPPPNVTGDLHMGHALTSTLQDILIRFKRMCGYATLWIPGTDHAGIATQMAVERDLLQREGKRRSDYRPEEFLRHLWRWKEQRETRIVAQLQRLGCSCDWSQLASTMDPGHSRAVYKVFKEMFTAGLIYRGDYLVNWDPQLQTAIADEEIEYEERPSKLWYFDYPLLGGGKITVATTRPETLLADVALAVAPHDGRYRHLIGRQAQPPLLQRPLPIISDPSVDPHFGSGVVKVTPAHDRRDHAVGRQHRLPLINVMTRDGRINSQGGRFAGLTLDEARSQVVAAMEELGLVAKVVAHRQRIALSYRSRAVVEPYLSQQWFVRLRSFRQQLLAVVRTARLKIIPRRWEKVYIHWIENLHDWCISRQLVWGHRIPIWRRRDDPEVLLCHDRPGLPPAVAAAPAEWQQEEDVLDTWFSSALWPLSILGWPDKTAALERFYPYSLAVTGHDILFFWVVRMVLMGEFVGQQTPFGEVLLHGLIYGKSYWQRDGQGRVLYLQGSARAQCQSGSALPPGVESRWEKMSKSKGNVIDPDAMIARYGADAVRMTLAASATPAQQIDLDARLFAEQHNFSNKVWNGARFILAHLSDLEGACLRTGLQGATLALEDRWLLSRLNRTIAQMNGSLQDYAFDRAASTIYRFYWKEFCAFYIEAAKPIFARGSLAQRRCKRLLLLSTLVTAVCLLHPIAPFVTEEIFQQLKKCLPLPEGAAACPYLGATIGALRRDACIVAPYPRAVIDADICPQTEERFARLAAVVHAMRTLRAELQLPPRAATPLYLLAAPGSATLDIVAEQRELLTAFVPLTALRTVAAPVPGSVTAAVGDLQLIIPLPPQLAARQVERLHKEQARLLQRQRGVVQLLANAQFLAQAPPPLVADKRAQLKELEESLATIGQQLAQLQ